MSSAVDVRGMAQKALQLDYFAVLGVEQNASAERIQQAFIEKAKVWHPDRVPDAELRPLVSKVFARLELARSVLVDPQRRQRYIEELARPPGSTRDPSGVGFSIQEAVLEFKKGEALFKKNDLDGAEKHLRRAIGLAPKHAEAQVLLALVCAKPTSTPDELAKLIADLDRIINNLTNPARAYFVRAQLKKRLGQNDAALKDFTRAAELDPSNVDAAREVRLDKMRKEKAAAPPPPPEPEGAFGFVKKLFKK